MVKGTDMMHVTSSSNSRAAASGRHALLPAVQASCWASLGLPQQNICIHKNNNPAGWNLLI
jgi:hypothetical protein